MLDYIPNDFGRSWIASRAVARRGVHVPLAYIDINEGNEYDAKIFSQIMYWHEPDRKSGESRLAPDANGQYWLKRNHGDWFKETRIKKATARKCLTRLARRGLIFMDNTGDAGAETPLIRVNWVEFERRIKIWQAFETDELTESQYKLLLMKFNMIHSRTPVISGQPPVTKEQPPCPVVTPPLLPDNRGLPSNPPPSLDSLETLKTPEKTSDSLPSAGAAGQPATIPPSSKATPSKTPKAPRKPTPHEPEYLALLAAFKLQRESMTKTADSAYWKAAAELRRAGYTPDEIPLIYRFVKRMAEENEWDSFGPMSISKYAPDWRKRNPKKPESPPPPPAPPPSAVPEAPPVEDLDAKLNDLYALYGASS